MSEQKRVHVFFAVLTEQKSDSVEHAFLAQFVVVADLSQIPAKQEQ
jgi:hypothetical protein